MTNANDSAYPEIKSNYHDFGIEVFSEGCLSKREMFAMAAMQGLAANVDFYKRSNGVPTWYSHKAVELADALIEELNKSNQ